MRKGIVLCADDYGQAPAISQGIIQLLQQRRLSAVSCMVNSPYWQADATYLLPFTEQADLGLHLNLTEGLALSPLFIQRYGSQFSSLSVVLAKACLRQWDVTIIENECHAQLDHFQQKLGQLPRFIDGHQHVHQFPVIREALLRVYEQRLRGAHTYIRWVNPSFQTAFWLKKAIIYASGTRALARALKQSHIAHNSSFSGIYDFKQSSHYPDLFPRFLAEIGEGGLIMCHPGLADKGSEDAIAAARYQEYGYFSSQQFLADCEKEQVYLRGFYRP